MSGVDSDFGPMGGEMKVTIRGTGFKPFDWALDIDNQNDTFCAWGPLGKTPAHVTSSTSAECLSPPNNMHLQNVPLKFTINNQNYTDQELSFSYFNPPSVLEVEPLSGPINGGTVINFWGNSFEHKNLTCSFGTKDVKGVFITKEHLTCTAPNVTEPGDVKLTVKYSKDRFNSNIYTFKYFADPEVVSVEPPCGPVEGFTQITVRGRNFLEQGFGKAKCIFNGTIYMNATVLDSNTVACDTPPLESIDGEQWYNVSVSLDGSYSSKASAIFRYYRQPILDQISPALGPISGDTLITVLGSGFN